MLCWVSRRRAYLGIVAFELEIYFNVNKLDDAGLSLLALYRGDDFVLCGDAPPASRLILETASDPPFGTPKI